MYGVGGVVRKEGQQRREVEKEREGERLNGNWMTFSSTQRAISINYLTFLYYVFYLYSETPIEGRREKVL
jgi:hypothetical protein